MPITFIITTPRFLYMFEQTEKVTVLGKWLTFNEQTNSSLVIAKIDAPNKWFKSRVNSKLMLGRKYSHIVMSDNTIPTQVMRQWLMQPLKDEHGSEVHKALITLSTNERVALFSKLYPHLNIEPI